MTIGRHKVVAPDDEGELLLHIAFEGLKNSFTVLFTEHATYSDKVWPVEILESL